MLYRDLLFSELTLRYVFRRLLQGHYEISNELRIVQLPAIHLEL